MGDEQSNKHRVEALKTALKSQRSEALQREEALQSQLTGLWNWADKERKTLVRQVSELRSQLGAAQGVNTPSPPPSAASLSRILSTDTPQAAAARVQRVCVCACARACMCVHVRASISVCVCACVCERVNLCV